MACSLTLRCFATSATGPQPAPRRIATIFSYVKRLFFIGSLSELREPFSQLLDGPKTRAGQLNREITMNQFPPSEVSADSSFPWMASAAPNACDTCVSVVVPAYNEVDVLPEFYKRMAAIMDSVAYRTELVFVNDGSTDGTLAVLSNLRDRDPRIAIVDLSRNFGKEIAMT